MPLQSYEETLTCTRRRVHHLLVDGDAQERVWAAWALASREGAAAGPMLSRAFEQDEDVGVRRHLLVVLVGLLGRSLLPDVAAREPAPLLRAEATRYLARDVAPDDLDTYELLMARALDISWAVRATVAAELRGDAPPSVLQRAAGLLFDPDPEVGRVMCERVERGDFPREPVADLLEVLARLDRRPLPPRDWRVQALVLWRRRLE